MAMGYQANPGNASQIYFSSTGQGYDPARAVSQDSEGLAGAKLQQQTANRGLDLQAAQGAAQLTSGNANAAADRANQLQIGLAPTQLKRDIFGQVSPLLTGLLGSNTQRVGGQSDAAPSISRAPIWSADQIQQQVNSGQAANLAGADTQNRDAATRMAGQGFGTRSPLLAALQGATNMQAQAANTDTDRQTRWDAAQGNADQTYRTDQLATQQWDQAQQQDIARRQMQTSYAGNLASVLASLV